MKQFAVALLGIIVVAGVAVAEEAADEGAACPPPACCQPIACADQLFDLTECELRALFQQGTCPPLLCGFLDGYSLKRAGKCLARPFSKSLRVVWKGKNFHPEECKITNRWFMNMEFASAALGHGPSLCDGGPALIMDYRGRSLIWARQRDEVRQIGPNLYLGIAYKEKRGCMHHVQFFALEGCVAGCVCPLCAAAD